MTFSNYKFHASSVGNLMTDPRKKTDLLSKTTESFLTEVYIKEVFGREKPLVTAPMQKGTAVETDSLMLYERVSEHTVFKNIEKLENDYIVGTPDGIDKDLITDVKSSWDIWTFAKIDEDVARSTYYHQLLSYMWLTNTSKAKLVYALVNTPDFIMADELYRLSFKMSEEDVELHKNNYIYDDIDESLRIKVYEFDRDDEEIEKMKLRIEYSRIYLNNYKL